MLGQIGTACGYATDHTIGWLCLTSWPKAMPLVRIRGADLAKLLKSAPQRAVREAATFGLTELDSLEAAG